MAELTKSPITQVHAIHATPFHTSPANTSSPELASTPENPEPIKTKNTNTLPNPEPTNQPNTRLSTRTKSALSYLKDFVYNASYSSSLYDISQYIEYDKISPAFFTFISSITTNSDPTSYKKACTHPQWVKPMNASSHKKQHMDIHISTICKKTIGCKWVYNTKFSLDGTIERHGARLAAQGFTQVEGIDLFDIYSPVANLTTVILLLASASSLNLHLLQLDVHNALLHRDLDEEVYMSLPIGINTSYPNQVCKLSKSLYGLK